jgi:hypothetical protein
MNTFRFIIIFKYYTSTDMHMYVLRYNKALRTFIRNYDKFLMAGFLDCYWLMNISSRFLFHVLARDNREFVTDW